MPRPKKSGLDRFLFDTATFADAKVAPICAEFGIKGQITIVHLLCEIYGNGYYATYDEAMRCRLAREMPGVTLEDLDAIVNALADRQYLSRQMLDQHGILTSADIQARYLAAVKRRLPADRMPYLIAAKAAKKPAPKAAPAPAAFPAFPAIPAAIVGHDANAACMSQFFADANTANLEALAMRMGLEPQQIAQLRLWAERIIGDWDIAQKSHRDYSDWASHMIRLMWVERDKDSKNKPAPMPAQSDYSFSGGFGSKDF